MAGSLKTAFYNLVKYAANDITSWLVDFNGNMDKIDTALNNNKIAVDTAQTDVDNLETEYKTVVQTLAQHTTAIDNNEKAIAENSASIKELGDDVNNIIIGEYKTVSQGTSEVTVVEEKVTAIGFTCARFGNSITGSLSAHINGGEFHAYDREAIIDGVNRYVTDLFRVSGNYFNIPANKWVRLVGFYSDDVTHALNPDNAIVIAYLPDSGFTVIGYSSTTASAVSFTNGSTIFGTN